MSAAIEEVALIVHYQAKTGMGDEVAALLARHTAATRAERSVSTGVKQLLRRAR